MLPIWETIVNIYYKSDISNKLKLSYSLVLGFVAFVCSIATSSLAYAQVYDFNRIMTVSQGYTGENSFNTISFAQLEATEKDRELNIAQNGYSTTFGSFGDGQFIGSMSFDLTPAPELWTESASVISKNDLDWVKFSNSGLSPSGSLTSKYLHLPGIYAKYPADAQPIIAYPVPEPETYAMLLAGLALIAFTARRRNNAFSN
jgi:PEP-CTERM motif